MLFAVTVTRLSANDWVEAGFAILGEAGVQGIKIDRMAERLGVTKGSFYWHFKDVDDFLSAVATKWAGEMARRHLATAGSANEEPSTRLRNRLRAYLSRRVRALDREMRAWARSDERARAALDRTDRLIFGQITRDLEELGFEHAEAEWRASVLFYASIGYASVDHPLTEASIRDEALKLLSLLTSRSAPPQPQRQDPS
jgi:AcrR family transcriptional regulator